VVSDVKGAIEVEDQEQQGWKEDDRTTNNPGGDQSDDATEGYTEGDGPSLHNPGLDAEDTEA
jgi:hypothetical protein